MKKCPYCAEEIQDEVIVCRYCGRELSGSPNTKKVEVIKPEQSQAHKIRTTVAGLSLDAIGRKLSGSPGPQKVEEVKPEQSQARTIWTTVAGMSLGVTLVSFVFLFLFSGDPRAGSLTRLFPWGIVLGAIGLIVGIAGRGFSKQK